MHWKIKTFIFMLIIGVIIAFPFFTIKYFETEWPRKVAGFYFLPPFFIFVCVFGPKWYYRVVKPLDETRYNTESSKKRTDIVSIAMMILVSSVVFFCLMFSLIVTTNSFYGRKIIVSQPVLNYSIETSKRGKSRQYIDIQHPKTHDKIHFEVYRYYDVGEYFEKEMKIGIWGMLYSRE